MNRTQAAGRQAFALIELLVVIAIIAILLSILLPALRETRRSGRGAICRSNLRQMDVAHHAYANDFRSFIAALNGRAEDHDPESSYPMGWPDYNAVGLQARATIDEFTGRTLYSGDIPTFWVGGVSTSHPS